MSLACPGQEASARRRVLHRREGFVPHRTEHYRTETPVTFVLDASGSMSAIREDTIGGVNTFLQDQQAKDGWEVLFVGANQDAARTAEGMGIDEQNSLEMSHTGEGAQAADESTADRVHEVRETGQSDGFTDEDRRRQNDAI